MKKKAKIRSRSSKKTKTQYSKKELKKQRNILLILIPIFIASTIFVAIYFMKDANLELSSELDEDKVDRVELYYKHNEEIQKIEIDEDEEIYKIPKTSELLYFKAFKTENKTEINETIEYDINKNLMFNFSYTPYYNTTGIFESESINRYKIKYGFAIPRFSITDPKSALPSPAGLTRYYRYDYIDFVLNGTYQSSKNITYSISFSTNNSNVRTYIYAKTTILNFYKYQTYYTGNFTTGTLFLDKSAAYLTNINSTHSRVKFLLLSYLDNANFTATLESFNTTGFFWKEIPDNIITKNIQFSSNTKIEVKNKVEIYEYETVFTDYITITINLTIGSWIFTNITELISEVVITEKIHTFIIDDIDLFTDSYWGLRVVSINLEFIDLEDHHLDYEMKNTELLFL